MNPAKCVAVEQIVGVVAKEYRLNPEDILGKDRHKHVSEARLLCYWLAKETTRFSFPEIGLAIGGRDHTTVMSGRRRCDARIAKDDWLRATATRLLAALHGGPGREAFMQQQAVLQ